MGPHLSGNRFLKTGFCKKLGFCKKSGFCKKLGFCKKPVDTRPGIRYNITCRETEASFSAHTGQEICFCDRTPWRGVRVVYGASLEN